MLGLVPQTYLQEEWCSKKLTQKIILQLTAYTGLPKNILGYVGFRASTQTTGRMVGK